MQESLLKRIRSLIASRIGLLVREQDDELLRKVVAERVRALHLSSAEQYCQFLDSDADIQREREDLVIPLTTGETYFFRDSGQHALLKDKILPELIERRRTENTLRIWSAACSNGEEAYSLAMLLDEIMVDQAQWNILILGTDINRNSIENARRGVYTEWSFRGVSDERRQRYFTRHNGAWVLNEAIRRRVTFRTIDLMGDKFPDYATDLYGMDLIMCRNTFIYMPSNIVSRITDMFTETLNEGGVLITGHGELYAHHLGKLRTRAYPESIIYQKVSVPYSALRQVPAPIVEVQRPARENAKELAAVQKVEAVTPPPQPLTRLVQERAVSGMQQAWQYANQGQPDKAAQACREMIAINPFEAEPHYLLALLAQERGELAEAKELLKKVIYLDHAFIAAYLDLGDLYVQEDDGARASKMRSTARDLLKTLSGDDPVRLYGVSTVSEVLQYVEHLLNT